MLVSKNPYVVAARVNIVPKKPYFAFKTGEKFAQAFGLTVRSPIMKIWVLYLSNLDDMVSNVTACKSLFPVSFEIFRVNSITQIKKSFVKLKHLRK